MPLGILSTPGACHLADDTGSGIAVRNGPGHQQECRHASQATSGERAAGKSVQHFGHRLLPVKRQFNDQPHHLFGRQSPSPDAGRAGRTERLFNPRQRQMLGQSVKTEYGQNIRRCVKLAR